MLQNYNNYGPYAEFVKTGIYTVDISSINIDNWNLHFNSILNIMRDGIETPFVQTQFLKLDFGNGDVIELSVIDYWFNIIMWYLIVRAGDKIQPKHIFFEPVITRRCIKKYIDNFFISKNRKHFSNIELNNIIDDTICKYAFVDEFSGYLANTINLEDTIDLMNACPEFYDLLHADLSKVPIEDVNRVAMELTNRSVEIIKDSKKYLGYDHCLADSFRASEGTNIKQYKELSIIIGSKPNGQGGVFPDIINKSFITGGVNDLLSYLIESSAGRTAQILSKNNVGNSGHFARLLGLNNTDVTLHENPDYDCDTKNYQQLIIKDKSTFKMCINRYYRFSPNGMEYMITEDDTHLIEQTIYLRSPMTCASNSRGDGVCYKCYGDLAYTNSDINIGKIAAEELSSKLTQILLSAKHLLETKIKKIEWSENFFDIFEIDGNIIKLAEDTNFKGYYMIISPDAIVPENEDDYKKNDYEDEQSVLSETYNEYVTEFQIMTNTKELITIKSTGEDKMYLSNELNELIRKHAKNVDDKFHIPLKLRETKDDDGIIDYPLFFITIQNNELSKTMDMLMAVIDKSSETSKYDRHGLLQKFIDTIIEGDLGISAVHCEIILSNQIRNVDDILEKPEWQYPNEPCTLLTLNQALTNNASVVISLLYQRLSKLLYNPLTFRKNAPSFMDLFFMEQPQLFLNDKDIRPAVKDTSVEVNITRIMTKVPVNKSDDEDC